MTNVINFVVLVLSQVVLFLLVTYGLGVNKSNAKKALCWGLILGAPLGYVFDRLFGLYFGVFDYYMETTLIFLLVNGMFSYGVALATVVLFVCWLDVALVPQSSVAKRLVFMSLISVFLFVFTLLNPMSILGVTITSGLFVLVISDLGLSLLGVQSFSGMLVKRDLRKLINIYLFSVIMGMWYEAVNYVFPVWRWGLSDDFSKSTTELMVVFSGYLVLVSALLVGAIVIRKRLMSS